MFRCFCWAAVVDDDVVVGSDGSPVVGAVGSVDMLVAAAGIDFDAAAVVVDRNLVWESLNRVWCG